MENLTDIIEAILFAVGRSISKEEIKNALGVEGEKVESSMDELAKIYGGQRGINLVQVNDEYMLVSNKKYYEYVSSFVENSKKENLSSTCMEVLSIIAYNPKITKSEIENIRGVNSDSQVSRLLEYGLVEEVGRLNLPGRPAMFSVTKEFLVNMGINKIEDLPDYEKIKSSDKELEEFKEEKVEETVV